MPKFDVAIEAGDQCRVPFEMMDTKEIIFEMQRIDDENMSLFESIYEVPPCSMVDEADQNKETVKEENESQVR